MKKQTIALTGGSTGGHVFPLLSVYNHLKDSNKYKFIWVGEESGLEDFISEENNIDFLDIAAGKLRRYFDVRNFYEPLKNLTGVLQGIYYIWKYKIDIVFSKGGYVSVPLCLAAKLMGKKIYIHESDTVSGFSNKIISKIATKIFYTFPQKSTLSKKDIISGQILNQELLSGLTSLEIVQNPKLEVLVIAGSQGSRSIFTAVIAALPELAHIHFNVILGNKNTHFGEEFKAFKNVTTHEFISQKDLGILYKNTDIAITRGGATTLWELYYFGIHSLIIPLNHSAGNHQQHNGEYFKDHFESNLFSDNETLYNSLKETIQKYSSLRKRNLNLEGFDNALTIIEKEI